MDRDKPEVRDARLEDGVDGDGALKPLKKPLHVAFKPRCGGRLEMHPLLADGAGDDLHRAALLHDIGKVGVPVSILDKPGALTDDEFALIKKHPSIGARILEPIASYKVILPMVSQHHERYDGKGYPGGLSGDEIDIGAKILAVADTFDAVKSDRPYRKGWPIDRAIDLITNEAGHQFDPVVVDAFLEIMGPEKTKTASPTQYNIA